MARRHTLKLRELRRIRGRFALVLAGMALVTLLLLTHLGVRVFVLTRERISYLDFAGLCFYALACVIMTVTQIVFLRQLSVGAGRRIEELTYTDELTGLGNRRHIAKFLSEEFNEAELSRNPLSLLYIDLDDFKKINDEHGHRAGDLALRAVAHAIRNSIRDTDFAGRVGGDEFIVILPDTDSQCASVVAHRILRNLADISVTVDTTTVSGIAASIGISSCPANATTRRELIEDADRTMYAAKNAGKGTIVISIARPIGGESRASVRHITPLIAQMEAIVDRTDRTSAAPDAPAEERRHG